MNMLKLSILHSMHCCLVYRSASIEVTHHIIVSLFSLYSEALECPKLLIMRSLQAVSRVIII